jgi:hypothetical protein
MAATTVTQCIMHCQPWFEMMDRDQFYNTWHGK